MKRLAVQLLLSSALVSCAVLRDGPQLQAQVKAPAEAQALAPNCSSAAVCSVTVIVPGSCGGGIHVSPDPIVVNDRRDVTIEWKVLGGWEFAGDSGIVLRGASVARSFSEPRSTAADTFRVGHRNEGAAVHKYDVNLRKGSQTCSLDPTIVDQ